MTEPEFIDHMRRSEAYGHGPDTVELVETHISWVFLAGDLVYKIKKPVDFGFLDFTSLDRREHYCREELRLNRRLCPDLYLDVVPVVKATGGSYRLGGSGETVDWAVMMKRLPGGGLMKDRLLRGEIGGDEIDRLTAVLADFYNQAETGERVNRYGSLEVIRHNTDEDFWQTAPYVGSALSGERFDRIQQYNDSFIEDGVALLESRVANHRIRDGHGDLHMGNICLTDDEVYVFDCIEFNEAFRCGDVAADLGFLAMDLDFHHRADLARRLTDTFVDLTGDRSLFGVLDFYKCYRAYVRGKVDCFTYDQQDLPEETRQAALTRARRYFDLAYRYAGGKRRPRIVVFFGLMGSGKTTWARQTGKRLGAAVISSDQVRKNLAGRGENHRVYVPFGQGLYSSEWTDRVYEAMQARTEALAGSGLDVVLDASYSDQSRRREVIDLAARLDAEAVFVWLTASKDETKDRLQRRQAQGRSLSDGRVEIMDDQARNFAPVKDLAPARLITLDNTGPKQETAAALWAELDADQA